MSNPRYLGMMKPMVEGDAALWRLGQRRFTQIGLGAETYPAHPDHLRELVNYLPDAPVNTAHLPYHLDITVPEHRAAVVEFARAADRRLYGFTLHDQRTYSPERSGAFIAALGKLTAALNATPVNLFFEYVSTRDFDEYEEMLTAAAQTPRVYPCLDVGHIAVDYCRDLIRKSCRELRQAVLAPDFALLAKYIDRVQAATSAARGLAFKYVKRFFAAHFSRLHFHAHDAHPISKLSPYPIRDHLSYLQTLALPFRWGASNFTRGIFGPAGAAELNQLLCGADAEITLMLEIHAQPGRLPLGADADLFAHWADITNAEKMNRHLELIHQSYNVLTAV
ncbi:hypothetical protein FACS1894139_08420 [Planctomycetales bacterium]|nr:hypothetical protein FACS1894107_15160 [Planctomycetales bacterium]GHS96628.1 hypothetical protein FACS1894108_01560 [Planctomycetales bacterium]GHT05126.1 hypothetical protein FACS1894139_08420 [Planctomycetales bacterium]GHV20670.1 hypothetical protein AGMMS49959_08520 [Planctomycetales bacterium]